MQYALINENNIVVNSIEYDGIAPYTPAEGLTLGLVNDWVQVGDDKNIAAPALVQPELPAIPPNQPL